MSGATARFDIVNFPPTNDEWLINGLRGVVIGTEVGNVSAAPLEYLLSPGDFEVELRKMAISKGHMLFQTREECRFVVEQLGSHFGDLKAVLKLIVAMSQKRMEKGANVSSLADCKGAHLARSDSDLILLCSHC